MCISWLSNPDLSFKYEGWGWGFKIYIYIYIYIYLKFKIIILKIISKRLLVSIFSLKNTVFIFKKVQTEKLFSKSIFNFYYLFIFMYL